MSRRISKISPSPLSPGRPSRGRQTRWPILNLWDMPASRNRTRCSRGSAPLLGLRLAGEIARVALGLLLGLQGLGALLGLQLLGVLALDLGEPLGLGHRG